MFQNQKNLESFAYLSEKEETNGNNRSAFIIRGVAYILPKIDLTQAEKIPAMMQIDKDWVCQRCGEVSQEKGTRRIFYCPSCLALGRVDSNSSLYFFPIKKAVRRRWFSRGRKTFNCAAENC